MTPKMLASPIALALAAGLSLSSAAFAQTMVGDQDISDADLPAVTEHCVALSEERLAGAEAVEDAVGDDAPPSASEGESAQDDEADSAGSTDNTTSAVDFEAITLEDCRAAGLAM